MRRIEKVGVYYSLPWALCLLTVGTLMEPSGRNSPPFLGHSQSNGEMIITCVVAACAKQCLSWGHFVTSWVPVPVLGKCSSEMKLDLS